MHAALTALAPSILGGGETPDEVTASGEGQLAALGFSILPVPVPEGLADLEQLPGDMLDVTLDDGTADAVEFEADASSDNPSYAATTVSAVII